MRPIDLTPSDERAGARKPARGGPLAYIVVGALVLALTGVILLVLADNQISDRKAELSRLESQTATAEAEAAKLAAFAQFHSVRDQRVTTVTNLADSRFDWERVMRELSLILPKDVWLTNLTGTVRPDVAVEGGANISLRQGAAGPALELVGCAAGQESVARFISDLKGIDGVTRVGILSSQLPAGSGSGGEGGSESSTPSSGTCQTRSFIAQFQIVVAFDAAPIPAAPTGEAVVAPPPTTESTESSEATPPAEESTESSTETPAEG
ncbi:MAG TPA: PilN domain-containing protein [Solirubrobacterales bacterium]